MRIPFESLHRFTVDCLTATSVSEVDAQSIADALVTTDAMGVYTHGTKLLAQYLVKLKAGGFAPQGVPFVERQGPAWAVVHGAHAMGQIGCSFALQVAIEKARTCGMAWVGLNHTGHIGAAGYFASLAARQGMIAMVCGNDIPSVAAPGAKQAVLGSNPFAYSIPVTDGDPILLDIATSAVAGGKVYAASQRGEPIPDTWLIGPDGLPTTDGTLYPGQAALAPMAGHKGYGIGLLCEMLSAVLPGGHMTWQVGSWIFGDPSAPSHHNASILLLHVDALTDRKAFDARLSHLIAEIHATPTAVGIDRVLLPGEREWCQMKTSLANGIALPQDVLDKLQQACREVGFDVERVHRMHQ